MAPRAQTGHRPPDVRRLCVPASCTLALVVRRRAVGPIVVLFQHLPPCRKTKLRSRAFCTTLTFAFAPRRARHFKICLDQLDCRLSSVAKPCAWTQVPSSRPGESSSSDFREVTLQVAAARLSRCGLGPCSARDTVQSLHPSRWLVWAGTLLNARCCFSALASPLRSRRYHRQTVSNPAKGTYFCCCCTFLRAWLRLASVRLLCCTCGSPWPPCSTSMTSRSCGRKGVDGVRAASSRDCPAHPAVQALLSESETQRRTETDRAQENAEQGDRKSLLPAVAAPGAPG